MRFNIGRTARGRWKRLSKSEILPIRLLSGMSTEQPELGASSMRFERSSLPPRPSRQWRCRRKPSDANVRRSCRVNETSRAKSVWPEESHKIAIVLSSNHQLMIPEHIPNRNSKLLVRQSEDPIERGQQSMSPTLSTNTVKTIRCEGVQHV